MSTTEPDALVASLLTPPNRSLAEVFADRPEVLAAIRQARVEHNRGPDWIAKRLNTPGITKNHVTTYLSSVGLL